MRSPAFPSPLYEALLALHVLVAAGAFVVLGSLGARPDGRRTQRRRRLLETGIGLVYLTPVLGVLLVLASDGHERFSAPWIIASFVLWAFVVVVVAAGVRPTERRLAAVDDPRDLPELALRAGRLLLVSDLALFAIVMLMVLKP